MASSGPVVTSYSFAGEWVDTGSGLLYLRARYYASQDARFISPDPLHGDIRNPQSLASYIYVENNPINYIDPSGLITESETKDADLR